MASKVDKSIVVDAPISTVYDQWTQFEEFPRFMEGVKEVKQLDDKRLHWRAEIGGKELEWDAEIIEQTPDRRISWRNTAGPYNEGIVDFVPMDGPRTEVRVIMAYDPKGVVENVGDLLGFLSGRVEGDLKRFKKFIESRGVETGAWRGEIHQGRVESREKGKGTDVG